MSIIAKLHIDDKTFNILKFNVNFNQKSSNNGLPSSKPTGGLFSIVFETTKETLFYEWMVGNNTMKNIKIVLSPSTLTSKSRTIELFDAYCLKHEENFDGINNKPMMTYIQVSPAIMVQDGVKLFEWYWKVTDLNTDVAPLIREETEEEEEEIDLKFIAKLEILDNYKGEFGFDWMRDDYKTICENYNKLKKEYTPTEINDKEYFVPWLSMFPKQENVKLKLTITEIEGTPKDIDIIKLPTKNGIKFEPNELKVSEANNTEITVICESPLNNNFVISLLDKDDEEVGKLNIFKNANHEQLHFNIIPVRILRRSSMQSDKDAIEGMIDHSGGFGDKTKDINGDLQNLQEYLNTQSLNQALLQANIGDVYDIVIDEEKWIENDLIINEGKLFKATEILKIFDKEFKKQHPVQAKKRGLVLFLSPLSHEGAGGESEIDEIDAKRLVVYLSNLWDKKSFAHEIAHVLGLVHSFQEKSSNDDINYMNSFITKIDAELNYMIENNDSQDKIAGIWSQRKDEYSEYKRYLNVLYRNPYIFEESKTENIMDYNNNGISFWKHQWLAMQDDMIKFYNIK